MERRPNLSAASNVVPAPANGSSTIPGTKAATQEQVGRRVRTSGAARTRLFPCQPPCPRPPAKASSPRERGSFPADGRNFIKSPFFITGAHGAAHSAQHRSGQLAFMHQVGSAGGKAEKCVTSTG